MAKLTRKVNFTRFADSLKSRTVPIKETSKRIYSRLYKFSQARPLTAFLGLLVILLALIVAGNFITKPRVAEEDLTKDPVPVETFAIGSAPRITVPAQVEKDGVITISAQTAGIVNKINVHEGQTVNKGQSLVSLSSNYQGGNAASVGKQLASVQAQTAKVTYDATRDIIAKQREIAEKTDANADELRRITKGSVDETRSQVTLNESILSTLESNTAQLEANNVGGANDALILQTKQLQSQFLAATNQARSALRTTEFQADENKPPSQLSNLARDVTIKQLDLQEKTTKLGLEAASLQVKLASINESLFFPTSPFSGTIERVHVKTAEQVSPGSPLITIASKGRSQTAVAYVPQNIAESISKLSSSFLIVDNQKIEVTPTYISSEAISGQLYAVIFDIPEKSELFTDLGFVDVEIPVGYSFTSESVQFVPIDSVHQTQDKAIIFVISGDKAEGKTVTLGQVQGNFIEVLSGLGKDDTIIVNRNIVSGDLVKATVK